MMGLSHCKVNRAEFPSTGSPWKRGNWSLPLSSEERLKHFRKLYEGYVPMKYRRYLRKMKNVQIWGMEGSYYPTRSCRPSDDTY